MSQIKSYKELIVWQKALELSKEIYIITRAFPREEQFVLTSQMRRAVISILSNIAEGSGRYFVNEWKQFYSYAYGSTLELEAQLILSKELKLVSPGSAEQSLGLIEEILKMLATILKNLQINYPRADK